MVHTRQHGRAIKKAVRLTEVPILIQRFLLRHILALPDRRFDLLTSELTSVFF
jgi:hypothetical protein